MCDSAHFRPVALKSHGLWRRVVAGGTRACLCCASACSNLFVFLL